MSGAARGPLRGKSPWPDGRTAEVPYDRPAQRQQVPYRCERGHEFAVAFLAGVLPPARWDCRCGAPAALADARPAAAEPQRPASRRMEDDPGHCMAMVLQRRSRTELEAMLAERLAGLHQAAEGEEAIHEP